jgi:hypothetical protein
MILPCSIQVNSKIKSDEIGNSGPDLRQALNCSGVKPVNVIYIYIPSSVGSPWIHSTLHVWLLPFKKKDPDALKKVLHFVKPCYHSYLVITGQCLLADGANAPACLCDHGFGGLSCDSCLTHLCFQCFVYMYL